MSRAVFQVFSCDIPTQRMASPTHTAAAGVGSEVNTETVPLSSQEFRGIGCRRFCCRSNPDKLSFACTAASLSCRRMRYHGNTKRGRLAPLSTDERVSRFKGLDSPLWPRGWDCGLVSKQKIKTIASCHCPRAPAARSLSDCSRTPLPPSVSSTNTNAQHPTKSC